jgi:hypothetical protein
MKTTTKKKTMTTDWDGTRRDLLKLLGVGAGCLPVLHASRAWAAPSTAPRRLLIMVITNGYRQEFWRPTDGSLATQTLPESSRPLEPHKGDVIFLPGLAHPSYPGRNQHGAYVNNLAGGPNDGMKEYRVPFTPTIDQIVGAGLGKTANVSRPSLNLGIMVDQGRAGIFPSKRSFWKTKTDPINPEPNPYKTYKDIFAGGADQGPDALIGVKKLMAHQKSVLDYVGGDLEKFRARLGSDDRLAIAGHMDAVRDLERQLATPRAEGKSCGGDPGAALDFVNTANYPQLVSVNLGLMVAALKCDVTRVAGLQTADATGGNIPFGFVPGVPMNGNRIQRWPGATGMTSPTTPCWAASTTSGWSTSGGWVSLPICWPG